MERVKKVPGSKSTRVYICHPLSCAVNDNVNRVQQICLEIMRGVRNALHGRDDGYTSRLPWEAKGLYGRGFPCPLAPHLLFPTFMDDDTDVERNLAMDWCITLLDSCEKLWVIGKHVSVGMQEEITHAAQQNIEIIWFDAEDFGLKEVPL